MPTKVLMFGWELPPFNSGGLGVACYGLSKALVEQGIDITFVLPAQVDVKADFLRLVFADMHDISWPPVSSYASAFSSPGYSDLLRNVLEYAKRAREIAKRYDCDLIHAHDWLCYPAGIAASSVSEKPLVTHVHATEFDRSGGGVPNPYVYAMEKTGLEKSAAIIAISQFTKNLLAARYLFDVSKITVVHNGVDANEFSDMLDEDPLRALKMAGYKIVLYVGRLSLQKGVDYLLKAAQKVLHYNPRAIFLVTGSGDMENQLITQTAELGISKNVLFTGFLRGKLWKDMYKSADVFIMPSVSEPFGLVALEAIASGTPVIMSKQAGVSETVAHALKVDFWDTDEMANKILSLISNPSLQKTLNQNGLKEIREVSWQKAAAKTIDVYKKILAIRN